MPAIPGVGDRTAPQLFGFMFNYGLMGALLVQVYGYYTSFPKDRKITKAIVYTIFILELAQTTIMSYFAYTLFGAGYGNLDVFNKSALEWFPVCVLGSLVAGLAQLFYANRIYLVSRSKLLGLFVAFLAAVQVASGIGQGVISKLLTDRSKLSSNPICLTIWLVDTALCDVVITASMVYHLRRRNYLSSDINDALTRIVRYSIETGAITAIAAIIQISVALSLPAKNYFETPSWTLGKLYSNCLLLLLNSRAVVKGGRQDSTSVQPYVNERERDTGGPIEFAPVSINNQELKTGSPYAKPTKPDAEKEERSNPGSSTSFTFQSV